MTMMELYDTLYDAQPKAAAAVALVETSERFGDRLAVRLINTRPLIGNAHPGTPLRRC